MNVTNERLLLKNVIDNIEKNPPYLETPSSSRTGILSLRGLPAVGHQHSRGATATTSTTCERGRHSDGRWPNPLTCEQVNGSAREWVKCAAGTECNAEGAEGDGDYFLPAHPERAATFFGADKPFLIIEH